MEVIHILVFAQKTGSFNLSYLHFRRTVTIHNSQ